MTTGTLDMTRRDDLAQRPLRFLENYVPPKRGGDAAGVVGRGGGDDGGGDFPERSPAPEWQADPKEDEARAAEAMEHRARGLLNLVVLLSRCLQSGAASPDEKIQWRLHIDEANEGLRKLYGAGLSRTFLSESSPPPRQLLPNGSCVAGE